MLANCSREYWIDLQVLLRRFCSLDDKADSMKDHVSLRYRKKTKKKLGTSLQVSQGDSPKFPMYAVPCCCRNELVVIKKTKKTKTKKNKQKTIEIKIKENQN